VKDGRGAADDRRRCAAIARALDNQTPLVEQVRISTDKYE
jgi:hypothetical protein